MMDPWTIHAERILILPKSWQAPLITLSAVVFLVLVSSILTRCVSGPKRKNVLSALMVGTGFAFCLAEVFLFSFGIGSTYLEMRGNGRPVDVDFQREGPWAYDSYIMHRLKAMHRLKGSVFDYPRYSSRFGLSDNEWPDTSNVFRVLVLGDSITEGDGAPYDSSWVSLIRKMFKEDNIGLELLNAGVCWSDPFEQFNLYQKVLAPPKPDLVIVTTSTPDFTHDCMVKGGMERFSKHGHNISFLEAAYSYSRVERLFLQVSLGYNDMLIRTRESGTIASKTKLLAEDVVSRFANELKVPLVFVLFPHENEVHSGAYDHNLDAVTSSFARHANLSFCSILDCYAGKMEQSGLKAKDLWWIPDDGHHKPEGYAMMANCIYEKIKLDVEGEVSKHLSCKGSPAS